MILLFCNCPETELTSHGGQVPVTLKVLSLLSAPFNLTMSPFNLSCLAATLLISTICNLTSASFFINSTSNFSTLSLILRCSVLQFQSSVWVSIFPQKCLDPIESVVYLKRICGTRAEWSRGREAGGGRAQSRQLVHTLAWKIILNILESHTVVWKIILEPGKKHTQAWIIRLDKAYSGLENYTRAWINHTQACKIILRPAKSY